MEKQKIHNLELWKKFKVEKNPLRKEKIKKKLVEIYYPLVQKISYKVSENLCWRVPPDELTSLGLDGLYTAIDRFSIEAGVDFPTYANRRIGGSMIDGIRKEDVIPRSVRMNNHMFEQTRLEMETMKGRRVTEFEVIEALGITQEEYLKNIKKYQPISFVSIEGTDICSNDKQEDFKQDSLVDMTDKKSSTPDSGLVRREFLNKLISKNFSKIEQKIIYMYYYDDLTMEEIARRLDMSESRISQIHTDVLPRLRNKIERNPNFFSNDIEEVIQECNDCDPLY